MLQCVSVFVDVHSFICSYSNLYWLPFTSFNGWEKNISVHLVCEALDSIFIYYENYISPNVRLKSQNIILNLPWVNRNNILQVQHKINLLAEVSLCKSQHWPLSFPLKSVGLNKNNKYNIQVVNAESKGDGNHSLVTSEVKSELKRIIVSFKYIIEWLIWKVSIHLK